MNEADDRRLEEAIGAWEQQRVWISLVITSALLAVVYPIANFFGAPHGTEPLRLRLIVAAAAIVFCVPALILPKLRRYAWVLLAIEIVAFYVIQGAFLAMTHFSPYVVTRAVLVISAVPLVAPAILDVELALGTFLITALVASALQGSMQMERISGPFGTILLASIIAGAVGVAAIESRRREMRARLAAELGLEERLVEMRTRDRLTGLPNFERFSDLSEDAITSAYIRSACVALIAIQIDRLDEIDRQYGTRIANALIVEVARRLEASAGSAVTSRIRSDRFVTIAMDADARKAEELAYEMLESLVEPLHVSGATIYVTATAGVAIYPDDGTTVDALLARCDHNLRRARGGAHDAAALVSGEPDAHILRLRELREDMHHALVHGEFRLFYQPCVDSRTGRPVAAEALLRWRHPKYGMIPPSEFISLLESDRIISTVGEWALREAVRACAQWRKSREIGVSVNVSLEQFRDAALCARVRSALEDANLPGRALVLELTESVAVQNLEYALRTMNVCRSSGVKFALDDFGTGYSSMSHLKELPIEEIKIDQSFIEGLPGSVGDAAIVRAIISLAHSLGCTVYAEGVEREEQARWLAAEGCDVLQGIAISPPLAPADFEAWLESVPSRSRSN
jgi:diguanylate cyclase (GGDEF)-like protein